MIKDKTSASIHFKTKELLDACWGYVRMVEAAERIKRKDNSYEYSLSKFVSEAAEEKLEREGKHIKG